MRAAILSSAVPHTGEILDAVMAMNGSRPERGEMLDQLVATAAGAGDSEQIPKLISRIVPPDAKDYAPWHFRAIISLMDALDRRAEPKSSNNAGLSSQLQPLFEAARELASDPKAAEQTREPAIRLLGRSPQDSSRDNQILTELVDEPVSATLKKAIFNALKRRRDSGLASRLLSGWARRSPANRQGCIEVLLSREEWTIPLLNALGQNQIASTELSPADRQRLLHHQNQEIQGLAKSVWPESKQNSRAAVLAKYQMVGTLSGDATHGSALFAQTCATCHFLRGQGHPVGPNLAALADKSVSDFLTAILDPNAAVEPRFVAYNIETKDARSLNGVVSAETATTLQLVQPGGLQESILRSDIAEIRASGLSLMPEGLEQNFSSQDFADLIAFLKTSPKRFGSATPQQAAAALRTFKASSSFVAPKLVNALDQLSYPSWLGPQPLAYCRQTDGNAKLIWQIPVLPTLQGPGQSPSNSFTMPIAMGFNSDPAGKFTLKMNGKLMLDFNVALTDHEWQSRDGKLRMTYTVMENNDEDSNGVLRIEVDKSLVQAGKPAEFEVIGSAAKSQRWFGIYLL
jgi:putative heme-binding domain-containing protein